MMTDIPSVGHTIKRCKQPVPDEGGGGDGGFGTTSGFGDGGFGGTNGFGNGAAAPVPAGGDASGWGGAPVVATGAW